MFYHKYVGSDEFSKHFAKYRRDGARLERFHCVCYKKLTEEIISRVRSLEYLLRT